MSEIKKTIGNITLDIHEAGQHNIDGKIFPFDRGIKIISGKMKLKVGPRDILALKALFEDPRVKEELQTRYNDEEEILKDMEF